MKAWILDLKEQQGDLICQADTVFKLRIYLHFTSLSPGFIEFFELIRFYSQNFSTIKCNKNDS